MSWGITLAFASFALAASVSATEDYSFDTCLRKDSISCVQIHIYKKLRALLSQDTINLLAGFQLVKDETAGARSLNQETQVDNLIYGVNDVADRQTALEDYFYDKFTKFFKERSFKWNANPAIEQATSAAQMALKSIPKEFKEKFSNAINEGRGRRNKFLKSLLPIIIAAKLKLVGFFGLAYVVIGLIAKKALLASVVALAITLFISIKKILAKQHHYHPHHYEVHSESYHAPLHHSASPGWSSSGWSGWEGYDLHGSHSTQNHHLPYSAQKPTHR